MSKRGAASRGNIDSCSSERVVAWLLGARRVNRFPRHRQSTVLAGLGANPNHRGFLDAELHGNRIGSLETNATNVAREPVRVL